MSVLKYAIAAAVGYCAGRPGGRRQLQRLRREARRLVRSPQTAQLQERGRTAVTARVSAVRELVRRNRAGNAATASHTSGTARTRTSPIEAGSSSGTGRDGRAVAQDVRMGVTPPSPIGPTRPTEQH